MINQILDLGRIRELGYLPLHPKLIDLNEFLENKTVKKDYAVDRIIYGISVNRLKQPGVVVREIFYINHKDNKIINYYKFFLIMIYIVYLYKKLEIYIIK